VLMMKFISRLHNEREYSSVVWHKSQTAEGVRYAIRRVSLLQRIELTKRVRELALRHEFLKAGDMTDQLDANLGDLLVRRLYLEWGLSEIAGLKIDGQPGTVELLIERGPEALSNEIVEAICTELELSEEERKNS
jgi:hypothetical protein